MLPAGRQIIANANLFKGIIGSLTAVYGDRQEYERIGDLLDAIIEVVQSAGQEESAE